MARGGAAQTGLQGERLVNLKVLAQYVGMNTLLQRRVGQRFLETARQTVFEIQQAERQGDYDRIGALAHRIKPSAMAMGATRMGDLATQLEQAANAKCSRAVQEQLKHLTPMMIQLEWEIATLC